MVLGWRRKTDADAVSDIFQRVCTKTKLNPQEKKFDQNINNHNNNISDHRKVNDVLDHTTLGRGMQDTH